MKCPACQTQNYPLNISRPFRCKRCGKTLECSLASQVVTYVICSLGLFITYSLFRELDIIAILSGLMVWIVLQLLVIHFASASVLNTGVSGDSSEIPP